MRLSILTIFCFLAIQAFAQPDTGNRSLIISPVAPSTPSGGSIQPKAPSIFDEKITDDSPLTTDKPFSMSPTDKFVDPNRDYTDRMNKKSGEVQLKVFRKDQYLGDIRTKAEKVTIRYRDSQEVDGDVISVYVNGSLVKAQVSLMGEYTGFELGLVPGFNKIEFEAVSEGYSQPNTAQYMIMEGKNVLVSSSWNLAAGFKGSYIIVRE